MTALGVMGVIDTVGKIGVFLVLVASVAAVRKANRVQAETNESQRQHAAALRKRGQDLDRIYQALLDAGAVGVNGHAAAADHPLRGRALPPQHDGEGT